MSLEEITQRIGVGAADAIQSVLQALQIAWSYHVDWEAAGIFLAGIASLPVASNFFVVGVRRLFSSLPRKRYVPRNATMRE
jgi:hypothetical protein